MGHRNDFMPARSDKSEIWDHFRRLGTFCTNEALFLFCPVYVRSVSAYLATVRVNNSHSETVIEILISCSL